MSGRKKSQVAEKAVEVEVPVVTPYKKSENTLNAEVVLSRS